MRRLQPAWTAVLAFLMLWLWQMLFGARTVIAAEQVSYRLKWLLNASVVGDLYAAQHGCFADAGLEVDVKAGGPERDAIRELELGHAQFGVASADQVIRALAKGAPVVVLAQLFQVNPLQWVYRAKRGQFAGLQDLKGRIIGITYGGNDETIMRTLLSRGGIDDSQVTLFSVRYDYTPFFRNQVDLWPVYRNTQAIMLTEKLAAAGEPLAFFDPSQFGVRFVANSVVTSRRMMQQHPQLVRRFMRALLKGWQAALEPANETQAVDTVQAFDRDTPRDVIVQQVQATRELIRPDPDVAIGAIDAQAWDQTEQIMLQQQQIMRPVEVHKALITTAWDR